MLINPIFDERFWIKDACETVQNKIRYVNTDTLFLLEMDVNGIWLTAAGFEKIQDGVFWTDNNPNIYLKNAYGTFLIETLYEYAMYKQLDWLDAAHFLEFFGVADSPEQLLHHPVFYKQFVEPKDEHYVICCTPIYKSEQPKHSGWKWNEHGSYIGCYTPKSEYLNDEPDIDSVIVFRIFMITDKKTDGNFIIDLIK